MNCLSKARRDPRNRKRPRLGLETEADIPAIDSLNRAIFKGDYEAELIKKLRVESAVLLSMVAVIGEQVVGHILFSRLRVEVEGHPVAAAALAPMCVSLKHQRSGVGTSLVKKGLGKLKKLKCEAVIVLGHPAYYQRFGFSTHFVKNLESPFKGLPSFMGIELVKDALRGKSGFVKYPDAFGIETGI
jgi:putative acetyltransferase